MVTRPKEPFSIFHAAAICAVALALSTFSPGFHTIEHLPLLLLLSSGILVSMVFNGTSTGGNPLNMFPFLIAVSAGITGSVESSLVFAITSGAGSFFLESRIGSVNRQGRKGAVELFASVFFLCRALSLISGLLGGVQDTRGLPAKAGIMILLTLISTMAMKILPAPEELRTRGMVPMLFNLIPIPMAVPVLEAGTEPRSVLIPVAGAVFWVVAVQVGAFILTVRRRDLEKSLHMERSLAELTSNLSSAETRATALRMMLVSLHRGSGASRVEVTHGNLSMSLPVHAAPSNCTVKRTLEGLSVSLDFPVMPLVSPERVDAFLTRTAVILEWINVSEIITRETWESIETLVLSMERTDRKAAGFSKQVAETASELALRVGFDDWSTHCLRIAALLHAGSEALMGSIGDEKPIRDYLSESEHLSLPPVTTDALKFHGECWDGTGTLGLSKDAIPLGARLLSVCISWEKAFAAGGLKEAQRAMTMGRGSLHDPALTELLLGVKGRPEANSTLPVNRVR
jgi:hypothetical protein